MMEFSTILILMANWGVFLGIGFLLYKMGKKFAKDLVKEAIEEYSVKNRDKEMMHRITETRNKYSI